MIIGIAFVAVYENENNQHSVQFNEKKKQSKRTDDAVVAAAVDVDGGDASRSGTPVYMQSTIKKKTIQKRTNRNRLS